MSRKALVGMVIAITLCAIAYRQFQVAEVASKATSLLPDAIRHHDLREIKRLIALGADTNTREFPSYGPPPHWLHKIATMFRETPNRSGEGKTALFIAVEYRDSDLIRTLLSKGADVKAKTADGSALLYAVNCQQPIGSSDFNSKPAAHSTQLAVTVGLLLNAGADPNERDVDGTTPLMIVAGRGDRLTSEILLEGGANPLLRDRFGVSTLTAAVRGNQLESVMNSLKLGADPNETQNRHNITPLMYACEISNVQMVRFLLDRGADCNRQDDEGQTALIWALGRLNSQDVIKMLLNRGAKLDIRDMRHKIAYDYADEQHNWEIAKLLKHSR